MKRLWLKYLSLILIVVHTSILFAQFERNALILKRELVVNSSVSKQEQQDVLKLKSGGNYKGEYIKIESADVLFNLPLFLVTLNIAPYDNHRVAAI